MKTHQFMIAISCVLLFAAGCKAQYATAEASKQQRDEIERFLKEYVTKVAKKAAQRGKGVPQWLAGVNEVEVIKVEKMKGAYKALVRLKGKTGRTRYFLLEKRDGEYRVTGVL